MSGSEKDGRVSPNPESVEATTLEILRALLSELRPGVIDPRLARLDSALDRDLGLDSLGRAELLLRLGRRFGVTLPERLIGEAEYPRDLVAAILAAGPSKPVAERLQPRTPVARETVEEPVEAKTLIDALAAHARRRASRDHVLLWRADGPAEPIAYGALYREALAAAGGLIERGVAPGDRVAIMLPTSRDFFVGFFAVVFAGAIPVPIYPPFRLSQIEDHLRRQAGILRNAQTTALIARPDIRIIGELLLGLVPELQHIVAVSQLSAAQPLPAPLPATEETVALIQYTSGSTGDPKSSCSPMAICLRIFAPWGRRSRPPPPIASSAGCRSTTTWASSAAGSAASITARR